LLTEVLKEIRATEEKADDIRRRALAESRRIIQDAERKSTEILLQNVAKAEEEGKEIITAAEKDAQSQIIPVQQRADEDIGRIKAAARAKQEKAITMVMERIVKTYGYS
jgi:vacuolar-type H+-ATPase subunit H